MFRSVVAHCALAESANELSRQLGYVEETGLPIPAVPETVQSTARKNQLKGRNAVDLIAQKIIADRLLA